MKKYKFECSDVGYGVLKPVDGGFRVTDEITVVRHSEALDWVLSLLGPVERSCGCDAQYCTCHIVWDAIDDHLEEIAAIIEAERGK